MTSPLATGAAGASSEAVRLLDALMGEMDWDHTTLANEYEAALLAYIAGVEWERDRLRAELDAARKALVATQVLLIGDGKNYGVLDHTDGYYECSKQAAPVLAAIEAALAPTEDGP